jgi:hypothetical protein
MMAYDCSTAVVNVATSTFKRNADYIYCLSSSIECKAPVISKSGEMSSFVMATQFCLSTNLAFPCANICLLATDVSFPFLCIYNFQFNLPTREINKILSTEMDVLRRSARKSRIERIKK